ncbi:MAG: hypothetical protein EOM37_12240 [Proteobacteria bacterium]|nr:hypothetical protein [Pseudomonadota bacterium]
MFDDRLADAHFDRMHPPDCEEEQIECALCGDDVDEEETVNGICPACWEAHQNFDNALAYGSTAQESVKINGLFAKILTPDQIAEALKAAVMRMKSEYPLFVERETKAFLSDDDGDFADWMKKQAQK